MVVRKRLIFWLLRAYLAKWGKTIFVSFLAGLLVFFLIIYSSRYFSEIIPIYQHSIVGLTGAYTIENLPNHILEEISRGLTSVDKDGRIKPAIAERWDIRDDGKKYVFYLKKNERLTDGRLITSDLITYNFKDVSVEKPDPHTIIYKLKNAYAPFLVTVSAPIFQPGLVGSGDFRLDDIKLNGNFVQSITLVNVKDKFNIKTYIFYPSSDALKYAYVMGEVSRIQGLNDISFKDANYNDFSNSIVQKSVDYSRLVTLFYNNNDAIMSNKKIRQAISYTLPNEYSAGERQFLPYPPNSAFYNKDIEPRRQNLEHAKLLIDSVSSSTESAGFDKLKLSIKTLSKYKQTADLIASKLTELEIDTVVEEVDKVPSSFAIYLGDFVLSKDPDQYPLWHSGQSKNISKYKNLRIDKLLEDGRSSMRIDDRQKIYYDFQKFISEDVPASFLYFPYEYIVERR